MQRHARATATLVAGGLLYEVGCLWIWHASPRLTAIYNADFTAAFFAFVPWLVPSADPGPPLDAAESVAWLLTAFAAMSAGYLLAISGAGHLLATSRGRRVTVWLVVGFAAAFRVTLGLLPGLFSTDVFSYVMYGRIAAVHAENPYVRPPSAFQDDPFLAWVFPFWRDQPTVYGPLWTDLSQILSALTATWSPLGQVIAYRFVIVFAEAVSVLALWWLLGRLAPRDRLRLWLVYAWNPLVVFDLVGATHNDALMLALLLLGLACAASRRILGFVVGVGLVALSALVKFATALVVPLLALQWASLPRTTWPRAASRLGIGLGLPLLLAIVFWWPWLASTPGTASTPGPAVALGDAAGGRLVINSAPDVVALAAADQLLVARGLSPDAAHELVRFWLRLLTRGAFALWCAVELVRVWRARDAFDLQAVTRVAGRLLLGLPLLVLTWVWSWYFSWSLALAVLGGSAKLTRLAVAYTLVTLPVVYAHQYLNEQLPGGWVLVMATAPLLVLCCQSAHRPSRVHSWKQEVHIR
jgi:hypothetical protein